ncbi:hypothetical protein HNY73_017530 [Argiope bruennichi]|uniref:Uncharacterized protein n=1 Tax=Argiope bruennichi TaxID=94029 RepID=A0A8T0EBC7_ARGBR|nr:hypothetical protein HNY73_017530 [Argiope bruennichi]
MSLDRNHPVFLGRRSRDQTPPRISRVRSLDREVGTRLSRWIYRRYICILGDQGTGRRSLARRFFEDRGELRVDGNWWLRGIIRRSHTNPRGEVDLLIRIVPSEEEDFPRGSSYTGPLIAAGIHGNAALFIFTFVCARIRRVFRVEYYYGLFHRYIRRYNIPILVVGTKCDLRLPESEERRPRNRFLNEDDIRQQMAFSFTHYWLCPEPWYIECSVQENLQMQLVIDIALIMSN